MEMRYGRHVGQTQERGQGKGPSGNNVPLIMLSSYGRDSLGNSKKSHEGCLGSSWAHVRAALSSGLRRHTRHSAASSCRSKVFKNLSLVQNNCNKLQGTSHVLLWLEISRPLGPHNRFVVTKLWLAMMISETGFTSFKLQRTFCFQDKNLINSILKTKMNK